MEYHIFTAATQGSVTVRCRGSAEVVEFGSLGEATLYVRAELKDGHGWAVLHDGGDVNRIPVPGMY